MLFNDILQQYPELYRELHKHPEGNRAPGGESVGEVGRRMAAAADEIARCHQDGAVLVASHGMAVASLYCLASQIPLDEVYQYLPENAQPVVIQWNDRRVGAENL
jgi:probable phosphoglycerate mutase